MRFNYNNQKLTGAELLNVLENQLDPFTYSELNEYKGIVTKALLGFRGANLWV